jgi:hypothetical protein
LHDPLQNPANVDEIVANVDHNLVKTDENLANIDENPLEKARRLVF